ncbi:hypothetical protein [Niallia taxi]|uniref:hypothetical protein n=1 Tax=Niallia taxi TaxID=2499688 RepID=UPI003D29EE11
MFGIGHLVGFNTLTDLKTRMLKMLLAATIGTWELSNALLGVVRIFDFFENIGKVVRGKRENVKVATDSTDIS